MDRGLLRWILIIAGLVLAALWLFTVLAGTPIVDWVPPCSVLALGAALTL